MHRLVISFGSLPLMSVEIGRGTTRLGRARDNDIVLPLPEIGDRHAEIESSAGESRIRPVGEEIVVVNGITASETVLEDGDLISLGGYRMRWLPRDGSVSQEATPAPRTTDAIESLVEAGLGELIRIRVSSGPDEGVEFDCTDSVVIVGRAPECDLALTDDTASWRHLAIERIEGRLRIRDLGSSNGTFLDGNRIESAFASPTSRIRIGRTTMELAGPEPQREPARGLGELVGTSNVMQAVYDRIRDVCVSRVPVLITGETGTGKELVARAIHTLGPRSTGPFIPVNCAAIPREIMEDELFGHVRGAFTGADSDRKGAFERAHGGTIFLDEVGQLTDALQAKLLRVVEDGEIPRLGGKPVSCDFRVLSATNRDLTATDDPDPFRSDLYYRIAVEEISLPPLRDRLEDIPDLAQAFLVSAEQQYGIADAGRLRIEEDALDLLGGSSWKGNVRELRNVILRSAARAREGVIDRGVVEAVTGEQPPAPAAAGEPASLEEIEREAIRKALIDCNGGRRAAARRLGIAESTLYDKIKRYGLADAGMTGR